MYRFYKGTRLNVILTVQRGDLNWNSRRVLLLPKKWAPRNQGLSFYNRLRLFCEILFSHRTLSRQHGVERGVRLFRQMI
jgi:hypothetical protein